jgi:hypothetical protein
VFRQNRIAMVVLYPILLVGALYLMWKSRQRGLGVRGQVWFGAWTLTGALSVFSMLTELSIGLILFPVAALAIFWLAVHAPYWREAAGFPIGAALLGAAVILFA